MDIGGTGKREKNGHGRRDALGYASTAPDRCPLDAPALIETSRDARFIQTPADACRPAIVRATARTGRLFAGQDCLWRGCESVDHRNQN
jgi:hypothetical protein